MLVHKAHLGNWKFPAEKHEFFLHREGFLHIHIGVMCNFKGIILHMQCPSIKKEF